MYTRHSKRARRDQNESAAAAAAAAVATATTETTIAIPAEAVEMVETVEMVPIAGTEVSTAGVITTNVAAATASVAVAAVPAKKIPVQVIDLHQWTDQCQYQCVPCNQIFSSFVFLKTHVDMKHSLDLMDLEDTYEFRRTLTKYINCQLCNYKLLCDNMVVRKHMHDYHKTVTLAEYANMFPTFLDAYKDDDHEVMDLSEDICLQHEWANKATYECKFCHHIFYSLPWMRAHLMQEHTETRGAFRVKWYTYKVTERFKCKLCFGPAIPWDVLSIKRHLINEHGNMGLEAFAKKVFVADEEVVAEISVEGGGEIGAEEAAAALEKARKKKQAKRDAQNRKNKFSQDRNNLYKWANRCSYECALCQNIFHSYGLARAHQNEAHKNTLDIGGSANRNRHIMQRAIKWFDCQLCVDGMPKEKVQWDASYIMKHMAASHGSMNLQEYARKFPAYLEPEECRVDRPVAEVVALPNEQENVDVLKWANRCTFECNYCGEVLPSFQATQNHLQQTHAEEHAEEPMGTESSMYTQRSFVWFKCEYCKMSGIDNSVLEDYRSPWDATYIRRHMAKYHKDSSLEKYVDKFNLLSPEAEAAAAAAAGQQTFTVGGVPVGVVAAPPKPLGPPPPKKLLILPPSPPKDKKKRMIRVMTIDAPVTDASGNTTIVKKVLAVYNPERQAEAMKNELMSPSAAGTAASASLRASTKVGAASKAKGKGASGKRGAGGKTPAKQKAAASSSSSSSPSSPSTSKADEAKDDADDADTKMSAGTRRVAITRSKDAASAEAGIGETSIVTIPTPKMWANRCGYVCNDCPKTFSSISDAQNHQSRRRYKKGPSSTCTGYTQVLFEWFQCELCLGNEGQPVQGEDEKMLKELRSQQLEVQRRIQQGQEPQLEQIAFDATMVMRHLAGKHHKDMSLAKYAARFPHVTAYFLGITKNLPL